MLTKIIELRIKALCRPVMDRPFLEMFSRYARDIKIKTSRRSPTHCSMRTDIFSPVALGHIDVDLRPDEAMDSRIFAHVTERAGATLQIARRML